MHFYQIRLNALASKNVIKMFVVLRNTRSLFIVLIMEALRGHVKVLFNSPKMDFKKQNRYNEVLPCKILKIKKRLKNKPLFY